MNIVRNLREIRRDGPCSLALGAFDGLHRGHKAVIRAAVESPFETGVFTFDSSPSGGPGVMTSGDKEAVLASWNVKRLYTMDFQSLRDISAEEFAGRILFDGCGAKLLCCGEDFRFGKGAEGDVALLSKLCRENGAELKVVPPVLDSGEKVSSTRIRAAVEAGDIPRANRLLGRPFGFTLEVIHGNHIGAGLGTPTINQALPENLIMPPFGVYASWVRVGEDFFCGVTNIGVKPTVGSDRVLSETWMPDFSGDLYGQRVRLYLLRFIRPEKKFSSLDALKEEIVQNSRQAREIAAACPPPDFQ